MAGVSSSQDRNRESCTLWIPIATALSCGLRASVKAERSVVFSGVRRRMLRTYTLHCPTSDASRLHTAQVPTSIRKPAAACLRFALLTANEFGTRQLRNVEVVLAAVPHNRLQ